MRTIRLSAALAAATLSLAGCTGVTGTTAGTTTTVTGTPTTIANLQPFADSTGDVATFTTAGDIDETTSFFQPLGTNGRTCGTCHQAAQGMSLTPTAIQALFASTNGTDPLFAAVDGANYPTAVTGDATAHSLILNNGLIRIANVLPAKPQFTITAIHDPYGTAITTDPTTGRPAISVYRRPLPSSSLGYLSSVMWDDRESISPLTSASTFPTALKTDLTQQLTDAVSIHAQGTTTPTAAEISTILALEQGLYTAQITDTAAGSLNANGATGGPSALAAVSYYPGINDAFGADPTGKTFNPNVFTLYTAWANSTNAQQASIARGEALFNTVKINVTNVGGINDNTALGSPTTLTVSCSTCHDTPNVGNHSVPLLLDTGATRIAADETNNGILQGLLQLTAPDLPIFQITGCTDTHGHAVTYTTTDPGKALITGLCSDVNHVKVPILRGLAARAPYFHNSSAATLAAVVNFYDARFGMGLNQGQKTDLLNFLSSL